MASSFGSQSIEPVKTSVRDAGSPGAGAKYPVSTPVGTKSYRVVNRFGIQRRERVAVRFGDGENALEAGEVLVRNAASACAACGIAPVR